MSDLVLQDITKTFGATVAVEELSFKAEPGEFVCILGPSGCGKTTTLRLIAGFERPDAGRILIGGRDLTNVPPQRRDIGVVFQSYALFPHMTVSQNVAFGLEMRNMGRSRNCVLGCRRAVAGRGSANWRAGTRTSSAAASSSALRSPALWRYGLACLLLDEPLSNLDAKLRDDMREEIRRIQREVGITAIFVTHDQSEAFALADRVAVMDRGPAAAEIADPMSIYENPANATVGSFIGQANVLDGTVGVDCIRHGPGCARSGGTEILGVGVGLSPGTPCKAFVKHERVSLVRVQPAQVENRFAGRIVGKTYVGNSTSYGMGTGPPNLTLKGDVVPNRAG